MLNKIKPLLILTFLLIMLAIGTLILAQSPANFDVVKSIIGNGGGQSSSANYQVDGTIGQNFSSPPGQSSANYEVNSGFCAFDSGKAIYLPVIYNPS